MAKELKEKKVVAVEKKTGKTITLKKVKSAIRRPQDQEDTLIGLGLRKMNKIKTLEDTQSVRGMIAKVRHLIEIVG
jgi:large subunit ribosomal protein L30